MCEPLTIAALTVAVASTGYSMYSANQQRIAAKRAAEYNAQLGYQAAAAAEDRGAVEAGRVRSNAARMAARVRAVMVAQGQSGEGTASVLYGLGINSEADAMMARNNAARQAWGYRNQAASALYEGDIAAARARASQWGDLLGGASQVLSIASAAGRGGKSGLETSGDDYIPRLPGELT